MRISWTKKRSLQGISRRIIKFCKGNEKGNKI